MRIFIFFRFIPFLLKKSALALYFMKPFSRNIRNSRRNRRKTVEKSRKNEVEKYLTRFFKIKFYFWLKYQPFTKMRFQKYCLYFEILRYWLKNKMRKFWLFDGLSSISPGFFNISKNGFQRWNSHKTPQNIIHMILCAALKI